MPSRASERIQQSKLLRPVARPWELARPALIARLNEGQTAPLSIICGMAGSGKTTLARQWAAQRTEPVVWVSLDAGDDDLARFVQLLVAAVRSVWPDVGQDTLREVALGGPRYPDDLAIAFSNELLLAGRPLTVIVDDVHTVRDPAIFELLEWVFRFPVPGLHVCLVSRTDPPLPLPTYRAHGPLTEIRLAQLLLSRGETDRLLREIVPIPLSDATIDRLYNQTEGWITGLQLTALALRDADHAHDDLGALPGWAALEFFTTEIVDLLPDREQRRWLALAIPERINAELGWHLLRSPGETLDDRALLRTLEAGGFFLSTLGDDQVWFRFHPLFREALLDINQRRFGIESVRAEHLRAAEWFADNMYIAPAIQHFVQGGDPDRAAQLTVANAQRALATDQWLDLERWLQLLPAEVRSSNLELVLAQAWIHQLRGAHRALPALLVQARALAAEAGLAACEQAAIDVEIELLDAIPLVVAANAEALRELGTRAMVLLEPRGRAACNYALYYLMAGMISTDRWQEAYDALAAARDGHRGPDEALGVVLDLWARVLTAIAMFWHGELRDAEEIGSRVLRDATEHRLPRLVAQANAVLGMIHLHRNEIAEAVDRFGRTAAEPVTGVLFRIAVLYECARGAVLLDDDELMRRMVEQYTEFMLTLLGPRGMEQVRGLQAELALLRGDARAAAPWADGPAYPVDRAHLSGIALLPLVQARVLIGQPHPTADQLAKAGQILTALATRLEGMHVQRAWIAVRTSQAILLDMQGDESAALDLLAETIDGAQGFLRPFLDQGAKFASLLARSIARDGSDPAREALLAASRTDRACRSVPPEPAPRPMRRQSPSTLDTLSEREREILEFLAQRYANKEIAEALGISPLTVKRHTINIYGKLGVNSRREAVRIYAQAR